MREYFLREGRDFIRKLMEHKNEIIMQTDREQKYLCSFVVSRLSR